MTTAHSAVFDAIKTAGPTRADALARVTLVAKLLDNAVLIPGLNRRVGFDAVLGLVPGIGDAISAALASYIIWEARQLGLPRWKIARMIGNVAVDTAIGAIPLAGDVFDVFSDPQNPSSARFVSTVVKGIPSPAELAVLRERHEGRVVTISFRDGDASQASVFLELGAAGLEFELVYGGINDIQGRAFGHLTLAIRGEDAAIDRVLASIGARVDVTEVA